MANGGRIDFTVGFKVDEAGIVKLRNQLQELNSISAKQIQAMNPNMTLNQAKGALLQVRQAAGQVQAALNSAFNTQTGVMNLETLRNSLNRLDLPAIQQRFNLVGQQGSEAFLNISKAALTTTQRLQQTNSIVDRMGQTLINTLRWTISSSLIKNFTGAFQQAYGYIQHLDTSLNDIRIVTGKSADEMERFGRQANEAAKALGQATTDYTEASLIFYQQGLSDEEVQARAETTLKAANVTGQSTKAVSEQLTAVWNGYQVSAENTEEAVDKLAAVAATTAADLEELSTGMSKVAAAASTMGVDMDQLNATLATIESVTRQAPESVGTALKTIYARMGDLKLGESDEDGLKLGNVSGNLAKVGINILDVNGELRDMGVIIEEIGEKWGTWTKAQQTAVAESVAGKRQYNNLFALFDNWDMYLEALETSRNSLGTLQEQQDIYMESTAAHLQQLKTQWEDLYDSIFDASTINNVSDFFNIIVKGATNLIDSIGGGKGALIGLLGLFGTVFSRQIGQTIGGIAQNIQYVNENARTLNSLLANIRLNQQEGLLGGAAAQRMTELQNQMSQYWHLMSAEEFNESQRTIQEIGEWENKREVIQQNTEELREYFNTYNDQNIQRAVGSDDFLTQGSTNQKLLLSTLQPLNAQLKDLETRYKDIDTAMRKYNDDAAAGIRTEQARTNSIERIAGKLQGMRNSLENLHNANIIDDTKFNSAIRVITQLETKLNRLRQMQPGNRYDSFADGLIEDFRGLQEVIDISNNKLNKFITTLKESGLSVNDIEQYLLNLNTQLRTNQYQTRATAEAWSNLAGGISSTLFGFQSLMNLGNILNDDTLSIGQKIFQTLTSITLGIPMLLKGIQNLNSGLAVITNSTIFLTNATRREAIANLTSTSSIRARAAAYMGLDAAMGSVIITMAVLTAGVIALYAGYQHYIKGLQEEAEISAETAKLQQEKIDKVKQEKQAIDDLAKTYQELIEQRDIDGNLSAEQESQIYDLIKGYNNQDLILQALAGDYDKLGESIRNVQAAENDRLVQELKTGEKDYQAALQDSIVANAKMAQRDKEGFDLFGGLGDSFDIAGQYAFRQDLAKLLESDEDVLDSSGHISYDNLIKLLTTETEDLQEFLKKYEDLDAATKIRELLSKNRDTINAIKETEDSIKQGQLAQLGDLSSDDINRIDNLVSYIDQIDAMAQEALENGYVESYEDGREWAKQFVSGYSDELAAMDTRDTVVQAIAETFKNTDAATLSTVLQQGGNVDLLNRPILEREDGSYSTVSTITVGDESTGYINLTPIFVNPETGQAEELTDDALNEYIDMVLNGEDPIAADTKGLIIGGIHSSLEEAETAAQTIHELQDQYYAYEDMTENIAYSFENISDAGLQAIANHKDLFRLLYNEGWSFDDIVNNLSNDIDILTNEDHIVKIDAIIDKKFAEKELQELFSDTSFEIPFTQEDFNEFDDSSKYQALINLRQEEIQSIEDKIELERIDVKERTAALNHQIKLETQQIELFKKQLSEKGHSIKEYGAIAKQIKMYEDSISSAKAELEKLTDYHIDFSKQVELVKQGIKALNKDIDDIQSSYQALESVVTDYNDDGYLTLDNLQKILELDDAYVASLQIQNGQMSINEETSRAMIDAKLHLAEVEATELYLSELEAIAHNENVIASQNAYNADLVTVSGINQVIEAAGRGVEALMNYAAAKDAASVDYDATKTATEAYYNRMQLIKNVAAQPTKNILGKTDKSKSGSGSKAKEPKQEKYLEREEDVLRTINEELEQIESTLGRIQTINDHEWGIDAQKTLEVENELLDKQLEKLEEKRALQEKDLSIRRKQLEYEGVVFSEDGSAMLNAEGQLNALYAHYNTMVDTYNSLSAAEQETYKNQLDAEKDRIDKIEKKIDEYESGFSDYQSTLDELLDAHYAEIENEIKLFNNMVDVHLELNDAEKEWDDFWYDVIQDVQDTDFGGQIAKSMAKLETLVGTTINNTDSDVSVLTNHLLDTIAEVQAQIASANRGGEDSLFGDDTLASKENLENYRDKLMEALKAAKDEIDNISETYLKMLDDAQDKIDKQVDGWNSIGDQIQHDLDLIKLVSGEKAFNAFENFLNQQYQNDLNLINTQKQSKDFWKGEIDRYTQLLEVTDKNTVQWKTYSEALKKASENYRKAVQDLDKTVEEALKHLDEWRTNQVNAISTALDNAMSGGLGLETVEQEWKLINDYADKYLDNVERALDMEEYTNILNEAADAIGLSAANQEKLNRFRDEELKKLNEKEKLTSYDIDESKARLEILKQQMALEDAQRNKSNMRLRRDNQGNYVYQYVSNEEELEKAGQGTLTARREWYELVKKRWKETSDWIIESEKQQASLLQQIDEAEKNGEIETANKLKELYKLNQQDIVNAYAEAEKNKQDLYLGTAQYFDYVDNAAILPNSKATVRQLVNEWVGGDGQEGFVSAVNTAITKLEETQNKYAERTAVILTEAGIQYQQLKENGVDPTIDSLSEMVDTNEELRYTLDDVNDALRQQENNLYQCEMAYHRLRDAAANAVYAANSALNSLAQTAINTVQRVQAAVQAAQSASRITANSLMSGSSLGSGSGSSGGYSSGNSYYNKSGRYTAKADIGGTIGVYRTNNGRKTEQITISNLQTKYNPGDFGYTSWDEMFKYNPELKTLLYSNYYNAGNYSSFDTGGYTGAWGDSGKFAMLHQKELVLNQDDTANMLKAVEALREITNNQGNVSGIADTILRTSNIQAQALANVGAGLFQQLANMVNTSNTSTTRNMTVNADFSGVRSADAIYQALMELQNYGLQQNYSVDPMSSTPY